MTKIMTCTTCNGEGRIQDRRENNRDEENGYVLDEVLTQIKHNSSVVHRKYLYDCKIPYDGPAKDLIRQLRESGYKIRVRGSGERAKYSLIETNGLHGRKYDSHLPLKYASHVRLYITK